MKKFLLFMMMLFSTTVFAGTVNAKVTNKINFGISPKELQNIIKSEPLSNSHDNGNYAVYYFTNVEDPLGVKRELNSFAFSDNQLFSAVFDSATTDEEHAKIIEAYKKNINKISKEKMNIKEHKGALLLYNSKKIIEIYRVVDHTFINVALYSAGKLNNSLKNYE
ncbi:hypothetical protein HMPREF3180_01549 [Leptotrichia wadei]|uniref:DUF4358 domain-containing protein n=1 Tax=Leptotrichia wadei TaxID=157687 RepID=A0A134A7B8_9FUSO|nr:hypothetical protein [Leptotrichia wadei]KXB63602.1 hypothetical protein HMPREF3180_01549 [Leptotrichia wadei]